MVDDAILVVLHAHRHVTSDVTGQRGDVRQSRSDVTRQQDLHDNIRQGAQERDERGRRGVEAQVKHVLLFSKGRRQKKKSFLADMSVKGGGPHVRKKNKILLGGKKLLGIF